MRNFQYIKLKKRNDEERHDVYHLDKRIDGRTGGVFVGITHRVARDRRQVRVRTFAAVIPFFNVLFRIVPGRVAPKSSRYR